MFRSSFCGQRVELKRWWMHHLFFFCQVGVCSTLGVPWNSFSRPVFYASSHTTAWSTCTCCIFLLYLGFFCVGLGFLAFSQMYVFADLIWVCHFANGIVDMFSPDQVMKVVCLTHHNLQRGHWSSVLCRHFLKTWNDLTNDPSCGAVVSMSHSSCHSTDYCFWAATLLLSRYTRR